MLERINLRITHRLLYRSYMARGVAALLAGVMILMYPTETIGNKAYDSINDVLPYLVSGILWTVSGLMMLYGIIGNLYKLARIGITISGSLYAAWGVSLLTNMLIGPDSGNYMFALVVYMLLAITSVNILLEPPINPETAIKTNKE